jgi:hypothetical protein
MRIAFGLMLAVSLGAVATPVQAAAPMPLGYWVTDGGGERLLIQQNLQCSFEFPRANFIVSGSCSWNASSNGGILTIINVNQYQPAPVYYNVIWVDEQTITVEGDVFHRQQ